MLALPNGRNPRYRHPLSVLPEQLQKLVYGADRSSLFPVVVAEQIAERAEIYFRLFQQAQDRPVEYVEKSEFDELARKFNELIDKLGGQHE